MVPSEDDRVAFISLARHVVELKFALIDVQSCGNSQTALVVLSGSILRLFCKHLRLSCEHL